MVSEKVLSSLKKAVTDYIDVRDESKMPEGSRSSRLQRRVAASGNNLLGLYVPVVSTSGLEAGNSLFSQFQK